MSKLKKTRAFIVPFVVPTPLNPLDNTVCVLYDRGKMIYLIITVILALTWLGYETDWMRVRLLVGTEKPRNQLRMTIAEWKHYDKTHAKELEQARKEYAETQAYYKAHTCPLCKKMGADIEVEINYIHVGNSHCTFTGCPECRQKLRQEIIKSQKPVKPHDPYPLSHYPILHGERYGYEQPYGNIEIKFDGELKLNLNGGSEPGIVKNFMRQCLTPVRVGKRIVKMDLNPQSQNPAVKAGSAE